MVDIDLKLEKGTPKEIAAQTELAPTEQIELAPFVGRKRL